MDRVIATDNLANTTTDNAAVRLNASTQIFDKFEHHVEQTWDHVRHGNSTLGEKLELAGEAIAGVAAVAALSRLGLSRYLTGSAKAVLPKLALTGERAAAEVSVTSVTGHDLQNLASARISEWATPAAAPAELPVMLKDSLPKEYDIQNLVSARMSTWARPGEEASDMATMIRGQLQRQPEVANEINTGGIERIIPLIRSASGNEFRNLRVARELVPGKRNFVVIKGDVRQVLENLDHHNDGGKLLLREEMPDGSFSKELKTWVQHRDAEATIPFNPVAQECDLLISCHPETILDPVLRSKHVLPDSVGLIWNRFQGTQRVVPGVDKHCWFFDVFNDAYRTKYIRTGTF